MFEIFQLLNQFAFIGPVLELKEGQSEIEEILANQIGKKLKWSIAKQF